MCNFLVHAAVSNGSSKPGVLTLLLFLQSRRSFGQFDVLGPRATRPRRQSSNRDGQPGHEPKQLFVVKHPGASCYFFIDLSCGVMNTKGAAASIRNLTLYH